MDLQKLAQNKEQIQQLISTIQIHFQKAHRCFQEALKIHDEWKKFILAIWIFPR